MAKDKSGTGQASIGLAAGGPARTAALPGMDTRPVSETPEIVAERYDLALKVKRLERRLAEIDACLKLRTGERLVGDFYVNVSSSTQTRADLDSIKEMLGDAMPTKLVPGVRVTVVPA